jgi:tetratricopeptide (TPR) repeat protein
VHLFEPHAPYEPPEQLAGSFAHPYDGEIAACDAALRVLMAGIDQLRSGERVSIVTSDHGEGLGEHDEDTHSFFLFETTLHVPLIVHAPQRWQPGVVSEPVSLCDLAPTLLAFAGLRQRDTFGRPLRPDTMPRRTLYAESLYGLHNFGWSPVFARRDGPHKLIRSARSRAYDLAADPHELEDLLPANPDWSAAAMQDLEAIVHEASSQAVEATRGASQAEQEALASLGYLTGGGDDSGSNLLDLMAKLPDGTEQRAEFLAISAAQNEITAQRFAQAIPHLERALAENPSNGFAQTMLATTFDALGQLDQAALAFERAVLLSPRSLETRTNAARVFYRKHQLGRAAENYRAAIGIDPQRLNLWREAASVLVEAGELDLLLELLRERIAAIPEAPAPERAELHALYAISCLQSGRAADAVPHIERARQLADSPRLRVVEAQAERLQQRWDRVLQLLDPLSVLF